MDTVKTFPGPPVSTASDDGLEAGLGGIGDPQRHNAAPSTGVLDPGHVPPSRMMHARFDQDPQNYTPSHAAASSTRESHAGYGGASGSVIRKRNRVRGDDTGSTVTSDMESFYSYHSTRDLSEFVREFDGRMFNNQSDLYMMPSDRGEFERLDKQHYAFVLALGGLYPCADIVDAILSNPENGEQRAVLDLGCGSGIWALEMAMKWPQCEVVGLDLAPNPNDLESVPPNCRFEIDDINLGLNHYHGQFDVIHVRCIGSGIASYDKMMRDVEACLKPGGIVFFIDGDMVTYKRDSTYPIPVGQEVDEGGILHEGSWHHRMGREMRFAGVYNGADVDGLEKCIDIGIWDHELIDPRTATVASLFTPIGTWASSTRPSMHQRLQYTGSLIRQNLMQVSPAWHPMLKKYGVPQNTLDRWTKRASDELLNDTFQMSLRWRMTWGRRKAQAETANRQESPADDPPFQPEVVLKESASVDAIGQSDMEQPSNAKPHRDSSTLSSSKLGNEFEFLHICDTKEMAIARLEERKANAAHLPLTTVERVRIFGAENA